MRFSILFPLIFLFSSGIHSQQTHFQKLYDFNGEHDRGIAFCEIPGGGYYILGENMDASQQRNFTFVKKLDASGNIVWNNKFIFQFIETAFTDIELTPDLGCVMVGVVRDTVGALKPYFVYAVLKIDQSGNVIWDEFFNINLPNFAIPNSGAKFQSKTSNARLRVQVSSDKSIVVSAPIGRWGFPSWRELPHIFKLDSMGNFLWSNIYGPQDMANSPQDFDLQRLPGFGLDNIAIASVVNDTMTPQLKSTGVTMLNKNGVLLWMRAFDYQSGIPDAWIDRAYRPSGIRFDGVGMLVVTGVSTDTNGTLHSYNPYLFKSDVYGNFRWQKRLDRIGNFGDVPYSLSIYNNKYLIGGRMDTHLDSWGTPVPNGFMCQADSSGIPQWSMRYGQQVYEEYLHDVVCNDDGGFSGLGFMPFLANNPLDETWLVKTTANGVSGCFETSVTFLPVNEPQIYTRSFTGTQVLPLIPMNPPYTVTSLLPAMFVPCFTQDVPEISDGGSLIFFPNPASSQITVHSAGGIIEMYDSQGKLVYAEKEIGEEFEMDLSKYSSGIYMVRVYSEGKMMRGKLIISR